MLAIAASQSGANILDNHTMDLIDAPALLEQRFGKRRSRNFRHMFVLGDGEDFGFRQTAKGDAILQGDHGMLPVELSRHSLRL
ncbi:MAG: hypothetical protein Q8K85_17745 [Hyphomicrobium sp.]|nr:hypothetical protein [Hyphomicrobium sp.]